MHQSTAIYLPIGCVHRLANPGKIPLEIIEVRVGSYLGEDDIIRIEDIDQRCRGGGLRERRPILAMVSPGWAAGAPVCARIYRLALTNELVIAN
jgi:hypothetical protein